MKVFLLIVATVTGIFVTVATDQRDHINWYAWATVWGIALGTLVGAPVSMWRQRKNGEC
ncbi:MAG: hypothetical protein AB1710_09240 [Pseudomonadota bacterium]